MTTVEPARAGNGGGGSRDTADGTAAGDAGAGSGEGTGGAAAGDADTGDRTNTGTGRTSTDCTSAGADSTAVTGPISAGRTSTGRTVDGRTGTRGTDGGPGGGSTGARPPRPFRLRRRTADGTPVPRSAGEERTGAGPVRYHRAVRAAARRPVAATVLAAGVLHLVWALLVANAGGDLAAQDAWAEFAGRHPDSAYNLAWYGGMHPVSYSAVSPYLMSALGVRTTMVVAGTVSCGLLTLLVVRSPGVRRPLPPVLAGVFALVCNAMAGRVTFALGLVFALGAVTVVFCPPRGPRARALRRAAAGAAALLAALATAASPVAGLFLGVVAAALFLDGRRPTAYVLGVPPCLVVGLSAWLFPFSGTQPMPFASVLLPVACSAVLLATAPKSWRTLRLGCLVYAPGTVLAWAVDSPVGSNVTRLALVFAGVALLAALPWHAPRTRPWTLLCLTFATVVGWQAVKTVHDGVSTVPDAAWARELSPLVDRLQRVGAERGRVEVVPVRSHREASALAPYVNLARGWNRQADLERNPLFYREGALTPDTYHTWLKRWAVRYVVLPADEPDGAGAREAKLVTAGQPYLRRVWADANWRLYEVADPVPLVDPPAAVRRADAGGLTVTVRSAGPVLIRVPYSPWLGLVDGAGRSVRQPREHEDREGHTNIHGCLAPAAKDASGDAWTWLDAPRAGTYRIAAPYRLPRGTPCPRD